MGDNRCDYTLGLRKIVFCYILGYASKKTEQRIRILKVICFEFGIDKESHGSCTQKILFFYIELNFNKLHLMFFKEQ